MPLLVIAINGPVILLRQWISFKPFKASTPCQIAVLPRNLVRSKETVCSLEMCHLLFS